MRATWPAGRLLSFLLLGTLMPAADFAALRPEGYVSDFARVVPSTTRRSLEEYCAAVERATGAQIALVTLPSLGGEPIEDVANLLYRKWGVGQKGRDEGILVLLAINDRRSRLEVGYGLEPLIPDGYAGSVLREMRPALRAGDYSAALAEAARAVGEKVAAVKGVKIVQAEPARRPRQERQERFPWHALLVAGGILAAVMLLTGGSRGGGTRFSGGGGGGLLAGLLLGHLMGGGPRLRSGGGFGGYDSGDSFGGFGGGDSGGGGASSDW